MNKYVAEQLVRMTSSPQFRKTTHRLTSDATSTFCFTGLLCELFRQKTFAGKWERIGDDWYFSAGGEKNNLVPPVVVLNWAQVSRDELKSLVDENDQCTPLRDIAESCLSRANAYSQCY